MSRPQDRILADLVRPKAIGPAGLRLPRPQPAQPTGMTNFRQQLGQIARPAALIRDLLIGRPQDAFNSEAGTTQIGDAEGMSLALPNQLLGAVDLAALPFLGAGMQMARGIIRPMKPYFSQLARTISERMPERAVAEQVLAIARKGSRAEELEWSGLEQFLKSGQRHDKRDVLKYLEDNTPEIKEQWIDGTFSYKTHPSDWDIESGFAPIPGGGFNVRGPNGEVINPYPYATQAEAEAGRDHWIKQASLKPKWTNYTLPGGQNHRELVVTMPSKEPKKWIDPAKGIYEQPGVYNVPGGHAYNDPELDVNRLFHARVNDREIDGARALHVDELQSDWHQAGRKKGYGGLKQSFEPDEDFFSWLWDEGKRDVRLNDTNIFDVPGNQQTNAWRELPNDLRSEYERQYLAMTPDISLDPVPNAPFKDTWHELGMRRLIQEASEGGYERLTWTTGAQQRARWNKELTEHVDELEYIPETGELYAFKNGTQAGVWNVRDEDALEELIGGEMTKKLMAGKTDNSEALNKLTEEYDKWALDNGFGGTSKLGDASDELKLAMRQRDRIIGAEYAVVEPGHEGFDLIDQRSGEILNDESFATENEAISALVAMPNSRKFTDEQEKHLIDFAKKWDDAQGTVDSYKLAGKDIDVGDRLFKTLYDRKMVDYARRFAKKHGGQVEKVQMPIAGKYVDHTGRPAEGRRLQGMISQEYENAADMQREFYNDLEGDELKSEFMETRGLDETDFSPGGQYGDYDSGEVKKMLADLIVDDLGPEDTLQLAIDLGFDDFNGTPEQLAGWISRAHNNLVNKHEAVEMLKRYGGMDAKDFELPGDYANSSDADLREELMRNYRDERSEDEIIEELIDQGALEPGTEEVWSMTMTPQMRKALAEEGQPLFAGAPIGLAAGRRREEKPNKLRDAMRMSVGQRPARRPPQ